MFKFAQYSRVAAATVIVASFGLAGLSHAAEVTPEQMKAARAALQATGATAPFDNILPNVAEKIKADLIQASPNYQSIISSTVDAKALELAPRRADLEREAATIYAKAFTVDELNSITKFFGSDVGKKFLKEMPLAGRELVKAADIWGAGIQRDLLNNSTKALDKIVDNKPGAAAPAASGTAQPKTK